MFPLLSTLLSLSPSNVTGAVSRRMQRAGGYVLAGVCLLTAYVAGVVALAVYLAEHLPVWAALAALAAGFLVLAGLILWASARAARAAERQAREIAAARQDAAMTSLLGSLGAAGGSTSAIVAAALAGLMAGGLLNPGKGPGDTP